MSLGGGGVQVYKQKVKHLLYEQQNNISTLKADGELGLKLAGEEAAKREAELHKDCRNLNLQLKEQVLKSGKSASLQSGLQDRWLLL